MALNKSIGNMYDFVDTWNPIRGGCPHLCGYCYVPHTRAGYLYRGEIYLAQTAFQNKLFSDKIIFVGSMIDMWLAPPDMIKKSLAHCKKYSDNIYLFQSKDPAKMIGWELPPQTILGTTIETDGKATVPSLAPSPLERSIALASLREIGYRTMVSIEPIMDFNLVRMVRMIYLIEPDFVSIGADSKKHNLPEPSKHEVELLIKELEKFTEVRLKDNLKRILCQ